jgi:mono/diheme cytochrome c family protein
MTWLHRVAWAALGAIITIALIITGGYIFVISGGIPMSTAASPLPLEKTVARLALDASERAERQTKNPLPVEDANLLAGAKVYHDHCAFCHGAPNKPPDPTSAAMFPVPPQLFSADGKVTDDPEGITHWKVTNGIRLSGMPAFRNVLSDIERWQVTMLVARAGTLPPKVQSAIQP